MEKGKILYENYQKMVAHLAWVWKRRTGWEFDELMAEGNLVFVEALKSFNPKKASFSTYLYRSLQMRFKNLTIDRPRAQKRASNQECDFDMSLLPGPDGNPEHAAALKEMIERLGHDARLMAESALETPRYLFWMLGARDRKATVTRYALQRYFVGKMGWSNPRCWRACAEIRTALQTL